MGGLRLFSMCKNSWAWIRNYRNSIALFILALIFVILLSLYFYVFSDTLSENSNDWSSFGSYIGGISAIFNLFVMIYLSLLASRFSEIDSLRKKLDKCSETLATVIYYVSCYAKRPEEESTIKDKMKTAILDLLKCSYVLYEGNSNEVINKIGDMLDILDRDMASVDDLKTTVKEIGKQYHSYRKSLSVWNIKSSKK
jgi:hypothetical protein